MDQVQNLAAGDGIGAGERLVEKEHLRLVHERLGQLGPLPHALGIAPDGPVGVFASSPPLPAPARGRPRAAAAQACQQAA